MYFSYSNLLFRNTCNDLAGKHSLPKNSALGKGGKDKGGLVKLRSVVLQLLLDFVRGLSCGLVALATALRRNYEAYLPTGVSGNGGVGISSRGVELTDAVHKRLDNVNMKPHAFALGANNAALTESTVHGFVKRCFEKNPGRTDWVGGISDDNIEGRLVLIHEFGTVHNVNLDPRIIISLGERGEILLANINHIGIELANHNFLDSRVPGNLAQHAAVTATDDKNLLGIGVGIQREVGNHLLVGMLIALGHLDYSIKHQYVTIVFALEDKDILVLGSVVIKDLLYLKRHGLARPKLSSLMEPTCKRTIDGIDVLVCECKQNLSPSSMQSQFTRAQINKGNPKKREY